MVRTLCTLLLLTGALALAGCGGSSSSSSPTSSSAASSSTTSSSGSSSTASSTITQASTPAVAGAVGPEDVTLEQGPLLAPASTTTPGTPVDGIDCAPIEQLAYHVHAHLQVYVDGQPRTLPEGIGIPKPVAQQTPTGSFVGSGLCFYWLHTHVTDGIIHIESPTARVYTLGNFFDEWRQPLSASQVGPATGKVTAFLNGRPWTKSPRTIPLESHFVVQLDVGTPLVPYRKVSFGHAGL